MKPPRIYRAPYNQGQWLMEGISGRDRASWKQLGWTWARGVGGPGCYFTTDATLARVTANVLCIQAEED